ncbi:MAG TPA: hypothetical protein VGG74_33125 [Kofleriaceae bacterium]|jgi:hypothetical protein
MSRLLLVAAPALAVLAMAACKPDLPDTPPQTFVTAEFDPTTSSIPLPNDLVLLQPANSLCTPPAPDGSPACAEAELIQSFKDANGFPSDQAVDVTVDFTETTFDANGSASQSAPDLDLTTFTPSTFFVEGMNAGGTGEIAVEPIQAGDYVKLADHGELTIHNKGDQPWPPGEYAVLIRGGSNGVMTIDNLPVEPSQIFYLLEQNVDLSNPKNNGLLKAELGSQEAANSEGLQLDEVEALWSQFAFPTADTRFPHEELAILTTFAIQPTVTNVSIDPARSLVPLPIDLLRDPNTGKLSALAACTLAGSSLNPDGTCPSAAAAGFEALDGFATTGAILGPTSDLIDGTSINGSDLQLWDLSDVNNPVQVDPNTLILEPCEFTSGCNQPTELSPVIAIQPAGATAGDPTSVFRTKPLKDATDYAVVMTTGIKDKAGNAIGPGTVAKILHFTNPVYVNGASQLTGIDNGTAQSVEAMRLELAPLFAKLSAAGTDFSKIGIAYTFHTQTILSQANELAALPYDPPLAIPSDSVAAPVVTLGADAAFAKYGVDPSIPHTHIGAVMEFDITTLNALSPLTGAFLSDPTQGTQEVIHVLMTLPVSDPTVNTNIPVCQGPLAPFGRCAPLMIFRHGLGGGRADMLTVADSFNAAGMVVVAIDAAKHGDRAYCTSGATTITEDGVTLPQCAGNVACPTVTSGLQGDVNPPSSCPGNAYAYLPVSTSCLTNAACNWTGTEGIPTVSGNFLISSNFFRTRDTFRQDLIDEAQLVRAAAYVPSMAPPTGDKIFDTVFGYATAGGTTLADAFIIDPTQIYFSGQSLGAISGAADVATNPRITKAGFNVGGGTVVDVFATSPAFVSETDALLASLGITPGTSAYLQFLVVAKTVLDPADPINFVGHITQDPLPSLLPGVNPPSRVALSQAAYCDQTVPNPWNFIYANNLGANPLPPTGAPGTLPAAFELFVGPNYLTDQSCASGVEHGFITDWSNPTITSNAQADIANFVMLGTVPPSIQE